MGPGWLLGPGATRLGVALTAWLGIAAIPVAASGRGALAIGLIRLTVLPVGFLLVPRFASALAEFRRLQRHGGDRLVDNSRSPALPPPEVVRAAEELHCLGFSRLGQVAIQAFGETTPWQFEVLAHGQRPEVAADISFRTFRTSIDTAFRDHRRLSVAYTPPAGDWPSTTPRFGHDWMIRLQSDISIEDAYRRHSEALDALLAEGAETIDLGTMSTFVQLENEGMVRVRADLARPLRIVLVKTTTIGLAWLLLLGLTFLIQGGV